MSDKREYRTNDEIRRTRLMNAEEEKEDAMCTPEALAKAYSDSLRAEYQRKQAYDARKKAFLEKGHEDE